jgi:hypothetical protein
MNFLRALPFSALLVLLSGMVFADGAALFRATDFVARSQERGTLNKEESAALDNQAITGTWSLRGSTVPQWAAALSPW